MCALEILRDFLLPSRIACYHTIGSLKMQRTRSHTRCYVIVQVMKVNIPISSNRLVEMQHNLVLNISRVQIRVQICLKAPYCLHFQTRARASLTENKVLQQEKRIATAEKIATV